MELRRNIAKNTAIQTIGKLLGAVLSLISAGIAFRLLHDTGFGQYTTIMGFLQIFGTLMDFGLYIILVKRMSTIEEKSSPVVNTIFTMRVVSGMIFLGSAPLIALGINLFTPIYSPQIIVGMLLALAFFFFISLNQLLSVIFQKHLQSQRIAIGEFVGKLFLLLATITAAWLDLGLYAILLTMVLSSGINCLILFISSRRYTTLQFAWDKSIVKSVLIETWPIALSIVFVQLYFKGDIVFLTLFHTSESAIGWYGAPYKILEVLVTFPAMFTGLALPIITKAWEQRDLPRFQNVVQKSFDALTIVTIPLIAGTVALAPQIMHLLAGADFTNSTAVLRILILATGAIFLGTLFGYIIVAIGKQREMMFGYGFTAATAVALYLYAIPRFSIIGAAWVTVYSEVCILTITTWMVLRTTHIRLRCMVALKAGVAAVGMYVLIAAIVTPVSRFLQQLFTNAPTSVQATLDLLVIVPIGMIAYAGFMIALRAIPLQELREFIHIKSNGSL